MDYKRLMVTILAIIFVLGFWATMIHIATSFDRDVNDINQDGLVDMVDASIVIGNIE